MVVDVRGVVSNLLKIHHIQQYNGLLIYVLRNRRYECLEYAIQLPIRAQPTTRPVDMPHPTTAYLPVVSGPFADGCVNVFGRRYLIQYKKASRRESIMRRFPFFCC